MEPSVPLSLDARQANIALKLRARLRWCVFELAAYRTANPNGKITLKPLFLAPPRSTP